MRHDTTEPTPEPASDPAQPRDPEPRAEPEPQRDPEPRPEPKANLPSPGERRLAHPPSDRYRAAGARADAAAADADLPDPAASIVRGVAVALALAIVGAVAIVVVGGVLTLTTGLLVVAGSTGGGVGLALRWGAAEHLPARRRWRIAVVLAVGAMVLGQFGLWQHALVEGGVLPVFEYLGEVYGPLVLLEFATAAVVAWLAAR